MAYSLDNARMGYNRRVAKREQLIKTQEQCKYPFLKHKPESSKHETVMN